MKWKELIKKALLKWRGNLQNILLRGKMQGQKKCRKIPHILRNRKTERSHLYPYHLFPIITKSCALHFPKDWSALIFLQPHASPSYFHASPNCLHFSPFTSETASQLNSNIVLIPFYPVYTLAISGTLSSLNELWPCWHRVFCILSCLYLEHSPLV